MSGFRGGWWLGAALLLAMVGCGGAPPAAEGTPGPPPTPVETTTVAARKLIERFEAVGTIEAKESVTLASEIDGRVVALPFREGEPVERGALVARLDDAEPAAELARALALRDQSRLTFERTQALVSEGVATRQDLDNAGAALKVAEANAELAAARLAKCRISAPFAGITGPRRVSPGAYVRAGEPIADLAQIDELEVHFAAPERYLGHLVKGAAVAIATTAFPDEQLAGRVAVVDPILDPATRNARVIARVANPDRRLRPGMSADVTVVLAERDAALTLPSKAVFFDGERALVYTVDAEGAVTRRALSLGTRRADVVEVLDGLEEGEVVVTAGHQKLFDGAKIAPVPAGP